MDTNERKLPTMSVRAHVLLVVGWGALALLVLFGALALGLELPGAVSMVLVAAVAAVPAYLARSPLTPKAAVLAADVQRPYEEPKASESTEQLK